MQSVPRNIPNMVPYHHLCIILLGSYIAQKSIDHHYPITVDIEKNNTLIFTYAHDGTSPNNRYWLTRKKNVVKRFYQSSKAIAEKLEKAQMSFQERYGEGDYAPAPGACPIIVQGVGVIGVIAVSGLSSQEDHDLIIEGMKYLLEKQRSEHA